MNRKIMKKMAFSGGFLGFMVLLLVLPVKAEVKKWQAGPNVWACAYDYQESSILKKCTSLRFEGTGVMWDMEDSVYPEDSGWQPSAMKTPWGDLWFTSLYFQPGITRIGKNTIIKNTMTSVKNIYIPDTVTEIADNAFPGVTAGYSPDYYVHFFGSPEEWADIAKKSTTGPGTIFYESSTTRILRHKMDAEDQGKVFSLRQGNIEVTDSGKGIILYATIDAAAKGGMITCTEDGSYIRTDLDRDGKVDVLLKKEDKRITAIYPEPNPTKEQFEVYIGETGKSYLMYTTELYNLDYYEPAVFLMDLRQELSEEMLKMDISIPYDGNPQKALSSISIDGKTLKEGVDYTVTYKNNIESGTAILIITGKGDYLKGTLRKNFTIVPASITKATVTAADQTYTGKALTPAVTVKLGTTTLKKDTDYTVAYKNNTAVGTATVTVTGKGNYTGTATGTFKIKAKPAETEAPKSGDETEKPKSGTTPETSKSGDETEKPKSETTPETSKSGDETEKPKNETLPVAPKTGKETEPPKITPESETIKIGDETEKTKSTTETPAKTKASYKRVKGEIAPEAPQNLTTVEKAIKKITGNKDLSGATFSLLRAKGTALGKKSVRLTWKKVNKANKYTIYYSKTGASKKFKKLATVSGRSYTQKKLKKGTSYRYIVVAAKGSKALAVSKTIYVTTKGGKYGNPKSIRLSAKKKTLKIKKTYKLKKTLIKDGKKIKNFRKTSYESSNCSVAKVTASGRIKAVGKGTCYVYAYLQNGAYASIKVKVKTK